MQDKISQNKIKYSKDKEFMKFLEFHNEFFNQESTKWFNVSNLKSDEILALINFYEEYLLKFDEIYPKSREKAENKFEKKDKFKYKYEVKHKYKFHHYLFPLYYILGDRLDFFKNLKIAIDFWDQKNFGSALKHFKLLYDFILEIQKERSFRRWYMKSSVIKYVKKPITYGFLPGFWHNARYPFYVGGFSRDDMKDGDFKKLVNVVKKM